MKRAPNKRTAAARAKVRPTSSRHSSPVTRHPPEQVLDISLTVNGTPVTRRVPARQHLIDFLREDLGLTGSHVGCEHGVCGACTVHLDGAPVRACLMLAVQADGAQLTTVEGLAPGPERLHPVQEAFRLEHGLQCGFCTPGILMTVAAFLRDHPRPSDDEIRRELSGNLCRCTGYQNIVRAVRRASVLLAEAGGGAT